MKNNVNTAKSKQYGGTVFGIIIGLVIGLVIAVVVALMITKTSTPFTNKLGIAKSDAPAIQLTDPNKPLYGSTAKEIMASAGKSGASPATTAAQNNTPSQAVATRTPDAATKSDSAKSDSVTVDQKGSRPADSTVAKNDTEDRAASYYLQVGAFRDSGDAESARAKLALIGIESHISSSNAEGDNLYRVRVGPFDRLDNMNRMRSKLSENSIDVAVIKTPK